MSDDQFRKTNIEKCFGILLKNNYQANIIRKQLHKAREKIVSERANHNASFRQNISPTKTINTQKNTIRRCITYIPNVSENIANLRSTAPDLQICYCPSSMYETTINSVWPTENQMKKPMLSTKFPCLGKDGETRNESYVGQTKNRLHIRLIQHSRDIVADAYREKSGKTAVVSLGFFSMLLIILFCILCSRSILYSVPPLHIGLKYATCDIT